MINYKFVVTYIPSSQEGRSSIQEIIELSFPVEKTLDSIKQDIKWAFQLDGHDVISIEGGTVE